MNEPCEGEEVRAVGRMQHNAIRKHGLVTLNVPFHWFTSQLTDVVRPRYSNLVIC